ncbi:hypothetical protein [Mesobaculum littorinae]|uniref:hypothetical protein n=1 Tax=Mesobaculum littorinae TaxID=2486419 RepID=UPI0013E32F06|nr:hypothetical protein [Mesobaculum littorinae]
MVLKLLLALVALKLVALVTYLLVTRGATEDSAPDEGPSVPRPQGVRTEATE